MAEKLNGYKVKREIISSLPSIDGRLEEMSQSERDLFIKVLYKNTKRLVKHGVLVPIKEGHEHKTEGLQGSLIDIKLRRKFKPRPHLVIVGELFLEDQLYEKYQQGYLPAVSVETYRYANITSYTGKDEAVGEHIYGIALLGSTPASFPSLDKDDGAGTPYQAQFSRHHYGRKTYSADSVTAEAKDEITMEAMKELKEPLQKMMEIINKYEEKEKKDGESEGEDEPMEEEAGGEDMGMGEDYPKDSKEGEEAKKDNESDKDETIKKLKEKVARLEEGQISSEFSRMANEGYLTLENKEHFSRIARDQGLDFAREVFGKKTAPQAPTEKNTIDSSVSSAEDNKRLRESYKRAGLSDDEINRVFEKQQQMAKGQ